GRRTIRTAPQRVRPVPHRCAWVTRGTVHTSIATATASAASRAADSTREESHPRAGAVPFGAGADPPWQGVPVRGLPLAAALPLPHLSSVLGTGPARWDSRCVLGLNCSVI